MCYFPQRNMFLFCLLTNYIAQYVLGQSHAVQEMTKQFHTELSIAFLPVPGVF